MRFFVFVFALLSTAASRAQSDLPALEPPVNLAVQSFLPLPPCTTAGVWALGDHMLLARRHLGFSVVDARNPAAPVETLIAPLGYPVAAGELGCMDVKADNRWLYVTSESLIGGVYIYDARPDPSNPRLVTFYSDPRLYAGVHNVWIDRNVLYCASDGTRRIEVYDVRNRAAPVWLASLGEEFDADWAHDVVVQGNRAYCSFVTDGIGIYDVSNPARPVLLAQHAYPSCFTHNMWPTPDGRYLYTTDENVANGVGGYVHIWDLSQLPTITQAGSYKIGPVASVVHSVYVREGLLFVAYYKEGVRVCSLADPTAPVEIASFDTWGSAGGGCHGGQSYAGCWGIYPWDASRIFVSDMDAGAWILRFDGVTNRLSEVQAEVTPGVMACDFVWQNQTVTTLDTVAAVVVAAVNGQPVQQPAWLGRASLGAGASGLRNLSLGGGTLPPGLVVDLWGFSGSALPLLLGERTTLSVTVR